MTVERLEKLLKEGEGLTVEFKECTHGLNDSVFETVCSFSNRYGGYLLLGVRDDGEVVGVNPASVNGIKKNFANILNNPQKISPTLYLSLEEIEYEGKILLYVFVPLSSQVEMCNRRIFDRTEDADIDVTGAVDQAAHLFKRKSLMFTEREVFPYATLEDMRLDLIPGVKQMALIYNENHPWKDMEPMELFRSAGLYETNAKTGEKGFNLAGILLFGSDELVRSCAPGYLTDAIVRRENLDRYDDRLMVETNLIEAYDLLMDFIAKHTLDRFFLIGAQSVGVRSKIAREIVSNILCHRDYSSTFPAKIIIEQNRIYAENWNRSNEHGKIDPLDFTPRPKNPIIARFFVQIGRADKLGSGVRNLYEYTRLYTGGAEPELIEGDVFRTIVPLVNLSLTQTSDKLSDKSELSDKLSDKSFAANEAFLEMLMPLFQVSEWIDTGAASNISGKSLPTVRRIMKQLVDAGILEAGGANKNRKYRLLPKPTDNAT